MKLIDAIIDKFFALRVSARIGVIALLAVVAGAAFVVTDNNTHHFECDNGGLSVVVQQETDNSAWLIAEKYCTGHIGAATDALIERYGETLQPGQIIKLP